MTIRNSNISGIILSGGQGRRVKDQDKGLLCFQDRMLIEQQVEWLRPQVSSMMISANRNIEKYSRFGVPVLSDIHPAFQGPLEGVLQGVKNCKTEWLFVLPVDVPGLPVDTISQMMEQCPQFCSSAYLGSTVRSHYLLMLINKKLEPALESYIRSGERRVRGFLNQSDACEIKLGITEDKFTNLNYLSDYQ